MNRGWANRHPVLSTLATLVAVAIVIVGIALLSGEEDMGEDGAHGAESSLEERSEKLLAEWTSQMGSALLLVQERQEAIQQFETAEVVSVNRKLNRELRPIEAFGRESRMAFMSEMGKDNVPSAVHGMIEAGDRLSIWARTARTAGYTASFDQAREIADLGTRALASLVEAYELADVPLPRALQHPGP